MGRAHDERAQGARRRDQEGVGPRRNAVGALAMIAALALVVGVVLAVQIGRSGADEPSGRSPLGAVDEHSVPRGQPSAPVTLTVYEDFQCPACRAVVERLDAVVDEYVEEGRVRVLYRPIAFLDEVSTSDYSSRAVEAAGCVLDAEGPGVFVQMHDLLFDEQPAEGDAGLDDEMLADLAERAGADRESVADCMGDDRFTGWTAAATEQASRDGVDATPTILVNDERLELTAEEDPIDTLQRAVDATP